MPVEIIIVFLPEIVLVTFDFLSPLVMCFGMLWLGTVLPEVCIRWSAHGIVT